MSEELASKPLSEFAELTMGQSPDSAHINSDERGLPFLQGSAEFGAVHPEHDVYCTQPHISARQRWRYSSEVAAPPTP
ncbi:hypothetical protein [Luteimonas lutimaris]|uniref:hypothetical protein n=1 Tax=Luteimonas lutimaris TaxID=698645 RepID=UPI0031E28C1D